MTSNSNTKIGREGEKIAVEYLLSKGFRIIQTNWHYHHLEIDIIAETDEFLVFVEVKTRTSGDFGQPEDAISTSKIKRLVDAAEAYVLSNDLDVDSRFDVISIIMSTPSDILLEHFEDAFLAL